MQGRCHPKTEVRPFARVPFDDLLSTTVDTGSRFVPSPVIPAPVDTWNGIVDPVTADCRRCPRAPWDTLEDLVRAHRGALVALARREGLHGEEALDVVQDALMAWVTRYSHRPPETARRTLLALTRNLARNRRRRHAIARAHLGDDAVDALPAGLSPAEDQLVEAEDRVRLQACMAHLAELQRSVVTMRLFEERAGEEVAATLGLAPGHVAVLLHRARANLSTCLARSPR